jgi:hypothetical protein
MVEVEEGTMVMMFGRCICLDKVQDRYQWKVRTGPRCEKSTEHLYYVD